MTATQARTHGPDLAHPVTVTVIRKDGAREIRELHIHPLAMTIPPASDEDFDRLKVDIDRSGVVHEPLVIFEGKVLDGRHRLLIAGARKVPVKLREFRGTTEQARAYVWSANVVRRHLSVPQIGIATLRHFGPQVEAEAAPRPRPAPNGKQQRISRRATSRHREMAQYTGGMVTPGILQRLELGRVADAPETMARIESGDIRRVDQAVHEAARELGVEPPPPIRRTAWDRLGCAKGDIAAAIEAIKRGDRGVATSKQIEERCNELQQELFRIKQMVRYG